ncbi:hypothetical protein EHP00_1545 [Ecytonucleospora hepatopenaei]|uniref:Uncharacterized protein n=1 Tax=Ecytonucleospora hepatopenaei TaxID=646526 RepID=A0A1W0E7I7_9MICR|nr:hypothetical protein EHP00_1545 [Ecytonucleospora hepatopenaei]
MINVLLIILCLFQNSIASDYTYKPLIDLYPGITSFSFTNIQNIQMIKQNHSLCIAEYNKKSNYSDITIIINKMKEGNLFLIRKEENNTWKFVMALGKGSFIPGSYTFKIQNYIEDDKKHKVMFRKLNKTTGQKYSCNSFNNKKVGKVKNKIRNNIKVEGLPPLEG